MNTKSKRGRPSKTFPEYPLLDEAYITIRNFIENEVEKWNAVHPEHRVIQFELPLFQFMHDCIPKNLAPQPIGNDATGWRGRLRKILYPYLRENLISAKDFAAWMTNTNKASDFLGNWFDHRISGKGGFSEKSILSHINPIHANCDKIKLSHYILKTKFHSRSTAKNYFFNLYFNKLQKYRQEKSGDFYIIIAGDPDAESDFYCIPFSILSHVLIDVHMQPTQRWLGTIRNHELVIEKSGSRLDVATYYGSDTNGWLSNYLVVDLTKNKIPRIEESDDFYEGSIKRISIEIRDRDSAARRACIEHYKCKCAICEFDFGKFYGSAAEGFIHVHHIDKLANSEGQRKVDPIKDLIPLCPNCHSVVHLRKTPYRIKEVREMIESAKKAKQP